MEGPTPVSALLHSATLVLSGIILYIKYASLSYPLLSITLLLCSILIISTSVTIDSDIKKQAAISTCIVVSVVWIEVYSMGSIG